MIETIEVLRDGGINWDHFFRFEDLGNGKAKLTPLPRVHRYEDRIPEHWKVVGDVRTFCDSQGRSGVDLKQYKDRDVIVHYLKTHVMLRDGRMFELAY